MNNQPKFKKILLAPLDWGLGHATRCIPIIHEFLELGCTVTVAAPEPSLTLLRTEFPKLKFLNLNAYNIIYSKHKRWMVFKVAIQIPKILRTIRAEHKWLDKLLIEEHYDAIISDNRYGFYSTKTKSVFITHQLQIKTISKFSDDFIRKLTYKRIKKFNECWVPDFELDLNMAGVLSHPATPVDITVKYIGSLSRFKKIASPEIRYKYLVIISGPEPQRTIFEKKIFELINKSDENFLVVLGKPLQKDTFTEHKNCKTYNHLSTKEMEQAFAKSEYIVSRCGYTTVMDVLALKKKSILVPTPGQTEQEYLANHLAKQNWCYTFSQEDDFDVRIKQAETFEYALPDINANQYKKYVQELVDAL